MPTIRVHFAWAAAAMLSAATAAPDPLRERLAGIDVDGLSPREALELLFELNAEAKNGDA